MSVGLGVALVAALMGIDVKDAMPHGPLVSDVEISGHSLCVAVPRITGPPHKREHAYSRQVAIGMNKAANGLYHVDRHAALPLVLLVCACLCAPWL